MTTTNSLTLDCYFDVIGRQSVHTNKCFFDVVTENDYTLSLYTNNKCFKNASELDIKRYKVKPVCGFLKHKDKTYVNAKIVFVKLNENTSSFGDVVTEVCYTDKGGKYTAYIEPGLYNIEIYINNNKIIKRNQKIQDGMKFQYFQKVNGLIHKKYKDTVSFCGTEYKNIYGQLIDNKKTPIANAEIIVLQDDVICAYVKTDDDGRYSFALKNGKYTVKIRSEKSPIKSTEVLLDDIHGFNEQLGADSILFNKQQMIKM